MTTIILKNSSTASRVPTASDLDLGELAINTADGKLYMKKWNGSIVLLNTTQTVTSVNGQTGTVTLTTSEIPEGSNLYYTDTLARSALSASGALNYDSATGVFSYTNPSPTITMTGAVVGSVTLNGLSNGTMITTFVSSDTALANSYANLPTGVNAGKLAFDTSTASLYVWSGSAWYLIG